MIWETKKSFSMRMRIYILHWGTAYQRMDCFVCPVCSFHLVSWFSERSQWLTWVMPRKLSVNTCPHKPTRVPSYMLQILLRWEAGYLWSIRLRLSRNVGTKQVRPQSNYWPYCHYLERKMYLLEVTLMHVAISMHFLSILQVVMQI